MSCGGIGAARGVDDAVTNVLSTVKESLHSKIQRPELKAEEFLPVSYKTQVVAGTNFFVKVKVAEAEYVHARIYKDLQGNVSLHSVEVGKGEEEEIKYF